MSTFAFLSAMATGVEEVCVDILTLSSPLGDSSRLFFRVWGKDVTVKERRTWLLGTMGSKED
jgi:hypothetical protein